MSEEEYAIEYIKANVNEGLDSIPNHLKTDSFYKKLLSSFGLALQILPIKYRKDVEYVKMAVTQNGKALRYAHNSLYSNRDIILSAIETDGLCIMFTSDELKNDREIVKRAVMSAGLIPLNYLPDKWADDEEIIELGLLVSPQHFHLASERILDERRDLMLRACKLNGKALTNTRAFYKANKIPKKYYDDREIIITAIKTFPELIQYLPQYNDDDEIARLAIEVNYKMFEYCSERIRKDRDLNLKLCKKYKRMWIAHDDYKDDFDFVMEVLNEMTEQDKNQNVIGGISERLLSNPIIALKSLLYDNYSLRVLTDFVKEMDIVKQFIDMDVEERRNKIVEVLHSLSEDDELSS